MLIGVSMPVLGETTMSTLPTIQGQLSSKLTVRDRVWPNARVWSNGAGHWAVGMDGGKRISPFRLTAKTIGFNPPAAQAAG